jgi:hypothetical protein
MKRLDRCNEEYKEIEHQRRDHKREIKQKENCNKSNLELASGCFLLVSSGIIGCLSFQGSGPLGWGPCFWICYIHPFFLYNHQTNSPLSSHVVAKQLEQHTLNLENNNYQNQPAIVHPMTQPLP